MRPLKSLLLFCVVVFVASCNKSDRKDTSYVGEWHIDNIEKNTSYKGYVDPNSLESAVDEFLLSGKSDASGIVFSKNQLTLIYKTGAKERPANFRIVQSKDGSFDIVFKNEAANEMLTANISIHGDHGTFTRNEVIFNLSRDCTASTSR